MKTFFLITATLLISGCAGGPPAPEWQSQAFAALDRYTSAYLNGNSRVADLEFARAKTEIARTGRPDLMARIELLRCATQVASLELAPCAGYQALAGDAPLAEQAYASFIRGTWTGLEATRLPQQYQALVRHTQASAKQHDGPTATPSPPGRDELHQLQDPLARLVAAGALLQREPLAITDIDLAVETASSQGWRRPLLAWLGVQLKHHQAAGNAAASAGIQRRIDLVLQKN
ncbi:hypothetical protein [Rhodoferax sp.]|uniref:hypothetical protein n=1 Tax=Rhodoferax sp. TaxID=50421 RepID=UPI0025F1B579|nr:hypothetical protein [Rhodoferax sp.]